MSLFTMTSAGLRQVNLKPDYLPESKAEITDMEAVRASLSRIRAEVLAYIVKLEDRGRLNPGEGTQVFMHARSRYTKVIQTAKNRAASSYIGKYYDRLLDRLNTEYDAVGDMLESVLRLDNELFLTAQDTYCALLDDDLYVT
ncbi:hypothetical protein [Salibacterium sp. K-3]